MRRGRLSIATVAFVLLGMVFAGSALACSCARSEPAQMLAKSDGAIVGRLIGVEDLGPGPLGPPEGRFSYRILHVYRGALRQGAILTLRSSLSGAACGLPQGSGRHYGLYLQRHQGRWRSSLCSVIAPEQLRAAAQAGARGSASTPVNNCAN